MVIALILAGGRGLRFSEATPKQFVSLHEKPVIIHTLDVFEKCPVIDRICVVCLDEFKDHLRSLCDRFGLKKIHWIFSGGDNRHRSIINGLRQLHEVGVDNNTKIILHNANMPLVTVDNITACAEKLNGTIEIVSTVSKCNEYLFAIDKKTGDLTIGPDRDTLVFSKLPECLLPKTGLEMYNNPDYDISKYSSYSTGLLGLIDGKKVGYVECDPTNFKITYSGDLKLMNAYFNSNEEGNR